MSNYTADYEYPHNRLETDEIVTNFKYRYSELKYLLDLKVKELQMTEINYQEILQKLQIKLDELENVNYKLKNLTMLKDNENEEMKRKMHELMKNNHNSFGGSKNYASTENNNEKIYQMELLVKEKDDEIYRLHIALQNYEKIINQPNSKSKNTNDTQMLIDTLQTTKEELEKLKEKFAKKYNFIKEKYSLLKHQNKEKDEILNDMKIRFGNAGKNGENILNIKDIARMEDNYQNVIKQKDKNLNHLLKYKSLVDEELKVIKQIVSCSNTR